MQFEEIICFNESALGHVSETYFELRPNDFESLEGTSKLLGCRMILHKLFRKLLVDSRGAEAHAAGGRTGASKCALQRRTPASLNLDLVIRGLRVRACSYKPGDFFFFFLK